MEKFLLCCDWGTSSFRLCLFDRSFQKVVEEIITEKGIGTMHQSWQNAHASDNTIAKADFFRRYLKNQVTYLADKCSANLDTTEIIISGMASSSIGMEDVPYATLPFAADGSQAAIKRLPPTDVFPNEIILISGVRSENDVMRGEETQLIGVVALLHQTVPTLNDGVFIFPGTHSKHVHILNGFVTGFNTFMTGELFKIISHHSILKASIESTKESKPSEADMSAFKLGVEKSKDTGILNGLFTVRTNQLFDKLNQKENSFYLSGLLIGEELKYLLKDQDLRLVLCTASNLSAFYELAIEALNLVNRTTVVVAELIDKSALAGQIVIFENHMLNT